MADSKKEDCKYWDKCYQKNPAHHAKFNHPPAVTSKIKDNVSEDEQQPPREHTSPSPGSSSKRHRSPHSASKENSTKSPKSPRDDKSADSAKASEPTSEEACARKEMDITKEYNEVIKNLSKENYFATLQQRIEESQKKEYEDLLKTDEFIRNSFLVEMPEDFYEFWNFCKTLVKKEDQKAEDVFKKFGLLLVGPFDYVAGKFHKIGALEPGTYLRHWRFYYDPPEFQTVFVKEKTGVHYGYWRDEPSDKKGLLMARNDAANGCEFEFVGGNCFETLLHYLDVDFTPTPFNRSQVVSLKNTIKTFASEHKIPLDSLPSLKKVRDKRVVTKTFHRAGLVVPFDRKTELGYRALIESDANLKKYLKLFETAGDDEEKISGAMEKLQPMITAASIAADECDFGTTLELGLDLFSSGHKQLHAVILSLLVPGYSLLKRPQFIAIIKAHLEGRRKEFDLGEV